MRRMRCMILTVEKQQLWRKVLLLLGRAALQCDMICGELHTVPSGAAAVSAVYEALLQPAGLTSGTDPMEQLLLASLMGNRIGKTYTDPALHLSERMGERIEPAQLLAYRYASPEQGPKSGNREVHFLHRSVPTCSSAVLCTPRGEMSRHNRDNCQS